MTELVADDATLSTMPDDTDEPLVTKTGKVLTDADIQALADEAEAGYDVSHLAPAVAVALLDVASVDHPRYRLTGAVVESNGNRLTFRNQSGTILDDFELDDAPRFGQRKGLATIFGTLDGKPVTVRQTNDCGCKGTRKVTKA